MDIQFKDYQPKNIASTKKLWFAYFAIFLFFNVFVVFLEKYPNLLGYILAVNISKDNIASDGSFMGFIKMESGTYNIIFCLLLILSAVFLLIIFKINIQAKIDETKDNNGSLRLQLAYLIGSVGILLFLLHGELSKFLFFSVLAGVGFLKIFPKKNN